jgi:hypothetical protein
MSAPPGPFVVRAFGLDEVSVVGGVFGAAWGVVVVVDSPPQPMKARLTPNNRSHPIGFQAPPVRLRIAYLIST